MKFTLETVSCIGACGLAPVVTVNDDKVYGQMTPEALSIVLDELLAEEHSDEVSEETNGQGHELDNGKRCQGC